MTSSLGELDLQASNPPHSEEPLPPGPPRGKRLWLRIALGVVALAVAIASLLAVFRRGTQQVSPISLHDKAGSTQVLRLKGTTEAVRMQSILAPTLSGQFVATLTVTHLTPNGTKVKRGDVLAEFDRQSQVREFIDKQAEYSKLQFQVVEQQSKEDIARAKDDTEIKQAEDALRKAELGMQKLEILSRIDGEKARETLEEATATLKQLRETYDLKRKAAQAAVRILEIQRDRTREIMRHAEADAALLEIRSPLDGVVVLTSVWKQGKMGEAQEGDQLRPGNAFMQVVDPTSMQVRVSANQQDFVHLQQGQSAKIHLDAYPELEFSGRLEEMAPMGRNGTFSSTLRYFQVVFSVVGQDTKLMPDLAAAVDVEPAPDKIRR